VHSTYSIIHNAQQLRALTAVCPSAARLRVSERDISSFSALITEQRDTPLEPPCSCGSWAGSEAQEREILRVAAISEAAVGVSGDAAGAAAFSRAVPACMAASISKCQKMAALYLLSCWHYLRSFRFTPIHSRK
jgi:hypothetical protein